MHKGHLSGGAWQKYTFSIMALQVLLDLQMGGGLLRINEAITLVIYHMFRNAGRIHMQKKHHAYTKFGYSTHSSTESSALWSYA